ncbi:unnamed protein product [Rhizophagus irregularis]|nr:unnamed protein product [Rhizophagus irregularis]
MLACFVDLTTKFSKPPHDLNKLEFALAQVGAKLPHEEFGDVCSVAPNIESKIYIVPLYSFRQVSRSGSNVANFPKLPLTFRSDVTSLFTHSNVEHSLRLDFNQQKRIVTLHVSTSQWVHKILKSVEMTQCNSRNCEGCFLCAWRESIAM